MHLYWDKGYLLEYAKFPVFRHFFVHLAFCYILTFRAASLCCCLFVKCSTNLVFLCMVLEFHPQGCLANNWQFPEIFISLCRLFE
jgi:hypothetical protein